MKNKNILNARKSQSNFQSMIQTNIYDAKKMETMIHDKLFNNVLGRKRLSKTTTKYSFLVPHDKKDIRSDFKHKKIKVIKKNSDIRNKYQSYNIFELKKLLYNQKKILFIIDLLSLIFNTIVVTWLYFDNFDYVSNRHVLTESMNNARYVCLFISIISCILLIIRNYIKNKYRVLLYVLNLRISLPSLKYAKTKLLFEIVFHLIQPYPNLNVNWKMLILGNEVQYSINMIFFTFCMMRLYIFIKVLKYWSLFTNDNSERIFKFFGNKLIYLFLYKANIKEYSFLALLLIFGFTIYVASLIFKIFEYTNPDNKLGFSYFWNCIWYLAVTMTTIGYGDYYPETTMGRVIGVISCIIGIVLTSLVVFTLMVHLQLNEENEIKSVEEIERIYLKLQKNNPFSNYYHSFIKYKFFKFRHNKTLKDYYELSNKFKFLRKNFFTTLGAKAVSSLTVFDFCEKIEKKWSDSMSIINMINKNIDSVIPFIGCLPSKTHFFLINFKESKSNSFKFLNLLRLFSIIGYCFKINSISEVKGDSIISIKILERTLKELHVKNIEKKENSDLLNNYKDLKYQEICEENENNSMINELENVL